MLSKKDPVTGLALKRTYGPWMLKAFSLLAPLKVLRGTAFDLFDYTDERKAERQLIADYEALIGILLARKNADNHDNTVALATRPEQIRGFGHLKEKAIAAAQAEQKR